MKSKGDFFFLSVKKNSVNVIANRVLIFALSTFAVFFGADFYVFKYRGPVLHLKKHTYTENMFSQMGAGISVVKILFHTH